MDIRTAACFWLSRRLMRAPEVRTISYGAYEEWRHDSLSHSWGAFSDSYITGKDILDFGCGDGQLTFFLAREKLPQRIVGVDVNPAAIERCCLQIEKTRDFCPGSLEFVVGTTEGLPFPDRSFDTVLAFDCLEHVMSPGAIIREWHRVLRPGGRCLIEWFPYDGPWGPHMESLVPVPWAHFIFGERAMFRTAEKIYDLQEFVPRHWDLDEHGRKKPNKWRSWSSFEAQGYVNKLDISNFERLVSNVGFQIARLERRSFTGTWIRRRLGQLLMSLPLLGECFVSSCAIELSRPQ